MASYLTRREMHPTGDLLQPHDGGCRCWPHVSQLDAIEAVTEAATAEYRAAKPRIEAEATAAAEPVAAPEELCGNPDPTGGRWTDYPCWRASGHTGKHESRSHVWADGETIHGERLSDPAEPVAPDKEGNG